jgi:hypothetical protein
MPRDLLSFAAAQVFHCSGKGRSCNKLASCKACCATAVGITVLLLVLFCSSSALADTFGLGTAGPGNWGILETGTGQVSMANGTNITVNPGATSSQANLGINSGGKLNQSGTVTIAGAYYKFSTNSNDSTTNGLTVAGGTLTGPTVDSTLTTAAADATAASTTLAGLPPNQTLGTITASTTISATVPGRNVINLTDINMGNSTTLTLSGSATQSLVINVTGTSNVTLSNVSLVGGLTPANVIFNVLNGDTVTDPNPDVVNGTIMDINGSISITNNDTINGELISGQQISLSNNSDVEVVPTVPEASTAAHFTLGPLSLAAVMLLHRRFSRRKQTVVRGSHDQAESVIGAVKLC